MVELPKEKQERTHELVVKTQGIGTTNLKKHPIPMWETQPCGANRAGRAGTPSQPMEDAGENGITEMHLNTLWKLLEQQHEDLSWWDRYLARPKVDTQLCTTRTPDNSLGLFCDASSSYGIGIVIDGRYDSLKLVQGWRTAQGTPHDIGWAEALALELLITFLFESRPLYNAHLLVHTDNTGVIGAWNKCSHATKAQIPLSVVYYVFYYATSVSCLSLTLNPLQIQLTPLREASLYQDCPKKRSKVSQLHTKTSCIDLPNSTTRPLHLVRYNS